MPQYLSKAIIPHTFGVEVWLHTHPDTGIGDSASDSDNLPQSRNRVVRLLHFYPTLALDPIDLSSNLKHWTLKRKKTNLNPWILKTLRRETWSFGLGGSSARGSLGPGIDNRSGELVVEWLGEKKRVAWHTLNDPQPICLQGPYILLHSGL